MTRSRNPVVLFSFFHVLAHIIPRKFVLPGKKPDDFSTFSSKQLISQADSEPGGTKSLLLRESNRLPQQMKLENVCRTD